MARILYIANQRMPTEKAYGIQITKMCEAFALQGIDVTLLMPQRRNPSGKTIFDYYGTKNNFKIIFLGSLDFYWLGSLDKIAFLIKQTISSMGLLLAALKNKYDTIYSRDELPLFLLSFFRKNLVFEAHRLSEKRDIFYRRFKKRNIKIITISQGLKDEFIRHGFDPDNILVAHDGVDLDQFSVEKTQSECREILGLPLNKILVLYTGHLYKWKGAHVLAEAAKNLSEQFQVIFVGGSEQDLDRYRMDFVHDNIRFIGWRPHDVVPLYLKTADVLVLPNSGREDVSSFYTSPMKMFEYMASSKPIAASDLPSIREVLTEDTAFFFKPDDSGSLTDTINKVINNIPEAEKRTTRALQEVVRYSWDARANSILEFIKS